MKTNVQKAFTLVEVMIACVIFTLILESIYVTLNVGHKSWNTYSNAVLLKQEVRRAIIAMTIELRESKNIFIVKDNDHAVTLNFEKLSGGAVSYLWSDQGEDANRIIRKSGNNQRTLASHITRLSFDYPLDNQIIIEVMAGKGNGSFSLKEKVALRLKTNFFTH